MGEPLQIISTGEGSDGFVLEEANLSLILNKVPSDAKVAVVSVVGAFRTGKSFLLTFFLRYMRHGSPDDLSDRWMYADGKRIKMKRMIIVNLNHATPSSDLIPHSKFL